MVPMLFYSFPFLSRIIILSFFFFTFTFQKSPTMTTDPSTIQTITELADVLDTGLNQTSIESIMTLLQNGVHPDSLAALIIELRREAGPAADKWRRIERIVVLWKGGVVGIWIWLHSFSSMGIIFSVDEYVGDSRWFWVGWMNWFVEAIWKFEVY